MIGKRESGALYCLEAQVLVALLEQTQPFFSMMSGL